MMVKDRQELVIEGFLMEKNLKRSQYSKKKKKKCNSDRKSILKDRCETLNWDALKRKERNVEKHRHKEAIEAAASLGGSSACGGSRLLRRGPHRRWSAPPGTPNAAPLCAKGARGQSRACRTWKHTARMLRRSSDYEFIFKWPWVCTELLKRKQIL